VSVDIPNISIVFGTVAPPQGDVVDLRVHLGCTKEVSDFECVLQNWDKKYSPNGAYPITVGTDGHIDMGRGSNVPPLITCLVESAKYESSPGENFLRVGGRCWGEKLFRRVVTKTYENMKAEEIVKDLIDYFAGLSHTRNSTELIDDTDTTYTKLEYENTPVIDVLRFIAESADQAGVIGYDYRVAPDGKFEFFPRNSKTSSVDLAEKIEVSEYRKDVLRVRNKVTIYGAADKSLPTDKDAWTESLAPVDGSWSAPSGTVTFDTTTKVKGSGSIKSSNTQAYYAASMFTLNTGKEVDSSFYPVMSFWAKRDAAFNGNVVAILYDDTDKTASHVFNVGPDRWSQQQINVGPTSADVWDVQTGFNWTRIGKVRFDCWFTGTGDGSFWIDGLFFGGRRYSSVQEDLGSQSNYGLRELVDVDEELHDDSECQHRARAVLTNLKEPAEYLTVRSTVIDHGNTPILAGDKVHVELPNENVEGDFRVLSAEYIVDSKTQTLETALELGRETPLLADYIYALRSKTDHVSRYKVARMGS
jgi:hypothetical protein